MPKDNELTSFDSFKEEIEKLIAEAQSEITKIQNVWGKETRAAKLSELEKTSKKEIAAIEKKLITKLEQNSKKILSEIIDGKDANEAERLVMYLAQKSFSINRWYSENQEYGVLGIDSLKTFAAKLAAKVSKPSARLLVIAGKSIQSIDLGVENSKDEFGHNLLYYVVKTNKGTSNNKKIVELIRLGVESGDDSRQFIDLSSIMGRKIKPSKSMFSSTISYNSDYIIGILGTQLNLDMVKERTLDEDYVISDLISGLEKRFKHEPRQEFFQMLAFRYIARGENNNLDKLFKNTENIKSEDFDKLISFAVQKQDAKAIASILQAFENIESVKYRVEFFKAVTQGDEKDLSELAKAQNGPDISLAYDITKILKNSKLQNELISVAKSIFQPKLPKELSDSLAETLVGKFSTAGIAMLSGIRESTKEKVGGITGLKFHPSMEKQMVTEMFGFLEVKDNRNTAERQAGMATIRCLLTDNSGKYDEESKRLMLKLGDYMAVGDASVQNEIINIAKEEGLDPTKNPLKTLISSSEYKFLKTSFVDFYDSLHGNKQRSQETPSATPSTVSDSLIKLVATYHEPQKG